MEGLLISAYVENISTRKDRSVKITLGTQELNPEKAGDLFQLMNHLAAVYLSVKDIGHEEMALVDNVDPEVSGKTQSQRIRNVLFLVWKSNNEGFSDFDSYYKNKTEKYIEHLKQKIQPF